MAHLVVRGPLPAPTFDLDSWTANYDGIPPLHLPCSPLIASHTDAMQGSLLPLRLVGIALRCPSLALPSLTLAITYAKAGKNVALYHRLVELAFNLGFTDLSIVDTEWADKQEEANRRELGRLESELRGYKNNLIRESIRMGQEDLASLHLSTGGPPLDPTNPQSHHTAGYNAAYQAFGKMRDYCTTPTHINSMTLRIVFTALVHAVSAQQQGYTANVHWNSVLVNAQRLRSSGVKAEEQVKLTPIAHVVTGIAQLSLGAYAEAARSFLLVPFDYHHLGMVLGLSFERTVATANDVAVYGGLCALATLSRDVLMNTVLGGPFRAFLEQEPHMRKAINLYTTAKYQACIELLQRYYSDWSLDIYLGASHSSRPDTHVDRLFARIRERSMTAYFSSFSEVSLASLASTFPPPASSTAVSKLAAMEAEILDMIDSGTLDARLDVVNGILVAPQRDLRTLTHAEAKQAAQEVERTLLLRLHRVNMLMAGLEVPKATASERGWGNTGVSLGNGF